MKPVNRSNYEELLKSIPSDLSDRIGYGLYSGRIQFYIIGVDGTLAQLGNVLEEDANLLRKQISYADFHHRKLMKYHNEHETRRI